MKHKNDYSVIAFFENGSPKKWGFVHNLRKFNEFLNIKHIGWKYINVYNRRTKEYLQRFYPENDIPDFL